MERRRTVSICECFSDHFRKDHFLSRIDARVKLVVVLALLLMVLSYKGMFFPLIIASGAMALCLHMRIPVKVLILRFAQPLFIAAVVLALKFFFSGTDAIFSMNIFGLEITGHRDGLMEGLAIASRVVGGVSLVIALGFATPFLEFAGALSWLRVPRQFVEIMMFAYRYLFMFLEDGVTIYSAQKNRLGYAGIRKGLHSFGVLTGTLVLRGFEQSQKTSEAMIQRGYTGELPILENGPFKKAEIVAAVACVITGVTVWLL